MKEMTQRDAYRLKRRLDLGKPSPGKPQSAQQSQTQVFSPAARPQVPRGDVTHCCRRSLWHPPYPGQRLGHLQQRHPFFVVGTRLGVVRPLPMGDSEW